jgi:LysM repeat protein
MRAKEFITEDTRPAREKFLDKVIGPESGGKSWIRNTRSGAQGLFQFMPDTWAGVVRKARPGDAHYGVSFDQMRNNPAAQRSAANQISREYEASIRRNKMPDTATSYYLLHGHGPKGVELYNNPDKQLKDIYDPYARDRNGQVILDKNGKPKKSIVYRQNPNFDPNQKISDFIADRAVKMGEKLSDLYPGSSRLATKEPTKTKTVEPSYKDAFKNVGTTTVSKREPSTINKLKNKVVDIGTDALGAIVGAKSAYAGELPPEKKPEYNKPKSSEYYSGSTGDTVVQKGQTLSGIARDKGLSLDDIKRLNPDIKDLNKVLAGAKIKTKSNDDF